MKWLAEKKYNVVDVVGIGASTHHALNGEWLAAVVTSVVLLAISIYVERSVNQVTKK